MNEKLAIEKVAGFIREWCEIDQSVFVGLSSRRN